MITGSIKLSALKNATIIKHGKNRDVECLIIPMAQNHLSRHENGEVYLPIVAFEMKEQKDFATHTIKQSLPKDVREMLPVEEVRAMPILGNLKVNSLPQQQVSPAAITLTDDDLPF